MYSLEKSLHQERTHYIQQISMSSELIGNFDDEKPRLKCPVYCLALGQESEILRFMNGSQIESMIRLIFVLLILVFLQANMPFETIASQYNRMLINKEKVYSSWHGLLKICPLTGPGYCEGVIFSGYLGETLIYREKSSFSSLGNRTVAEFFMQQPTLQNYGLIGCQAELHRFQESDWNGNTSAPSHLFCQLLSHFLAA